MHIFIYFIALKKAIKCSKYCIVATCLRGQFNIKKDKHAKYKRPTKKSREKEQEHFLRQKTGVVLQVVNFYDYCILRVFIAPFFRSAMRPTSGFVVVVKCFSELTDNRTYPP